jgi:hypothetical protein
LHIFAAVGSISNVGEAIHAETLMRQAIAIAEQFGIGRPIFEVLERAITTNNY